MEAASQSSTTVLLFTRFGVGAGEAALQQSLAQKYFELLLGDERFPAAICFMTDGVKLVCAGSPVIEALRKLEAGGTRLIVCKTCLDYYALADQLEIGIVGSMSDIIDATWRAGKVISM